MAEPISIQQLKDASLDAISLAEFIYKPASVMVARRLAPPVNTLQFYIDGFDATKATTDAYVATIPNIVNDAINNTAVEGGVLADTFVVVDATLNQRQINRGFESIDNMLSIANPNNGLRVYVKSYHAGLKKGGGWFAFDSTSTETANGGTVLVANDGTVGRWLRQLGDSEYITPQMFGAKADGITDDYQAIMAAINSVSVGTWSLAGATVFFPISKYYSSESINLHRVCKLIGESSAHAMDKSTLIFAPKKDGIIVNRHTTDGAYGIVTSNGANTADGSVIRGLSVTQSGYNNKSASVLDYNVRDKTVLTRIGAFAVGDNIKVSDDRMTTTTFTADIVTKQNYTAYLIVEPKVGLTTPPTNGEKITGQTSGAIATIKHVGYSALAYVVSMDSGTFQVGETVSTSTGTFVVKRTQWQYFAIYTLGNTSGELNPLDIIYDVNNYGTGIIARARCSIENCKVSSFPFYGISFATDANQAGNANCMYVAYVSSQANGRHGIWCEGGDSNAGTFIGLNLTGNMGYGIKDHSFLGNHYFSCHASLNYIGDYYSAEYNNFSVFLGCYSEGGASYSPFLSQASRIGRNSTVIGGDWGSPRLPSYGDVVPTHLNGNEFNVSNAIYLTKGNITPSGRLTSSLSLRNESGEALSLVNASDYNLNKGVGIGFYNVLYGEKFKRDNSDTIKTGDISVLWGGDYKRHGLLTIDLLRKPTSLSGFTQSVSPSSGGKNALFEAVVIDGKVTDVIMLNSGDKYPSAPTFTGTGEYAGVTIATSVFNGKIISYSITNNNTVTNVTPRTPQRAYNITYDYWQPSVDNNTVFGSSSYRWKQGFINDLRLKPLTSVTPDVNGELAFELTNDTTLTFKVKGSDGVVRSATLTLA